MNRLLSIFSALLAGAMLLAAGCSRQARAGRSLARAERYVSAGQPDRAERELRAALTLLPDDPKVVARLGLFYYQRPRYDLAAPCLARARDLDPDNLEVRLKLAELLMSEKRFKEARGELCVVLDRSPAHEEAILSLAETARQTNEIAEVRERLETYRQKAGDRAAFHLALATLHDTAGDSLGIETELEQALQMDPKSSRIHIALGNLAWARLDLTNAETHFQTARAFQPPGSPQLLRLVDFKTSVGAIEEAKGLLADILAHHPRQIGALRRWAALALQEGREEECRTAAQKILVMDPKHLEALLLLTQLRLKRGEVAQAVTDLEFLSLNFPSAPSVHYELGLAYLRNQDSAKALASFNQALNLDPSHAGAGLEAAQLNLLQGQYAAALNVLANLLRAHPNLWQAELLVAQAHHRRGNPESALAVYQRLARAAPKDPRVFYLMGATLQGMGRLEEARQALLQSLESDPASLMSLSKLAEVELAARRPQVAVAQVRSYLAKNPSSSAHQVLLAELYFTQSNLVEAEGLVRQTLEQHPESLGAQLLLARLQAETKHYPEALERLRLILTKAPENLSALLQLAHLHLTLQSYEKSKTAYERLLAVNPRHAPALRELAELYAYRLANPEKAWEFARRAREADPSDPTAAHTLGWILFQRREYSWALNLLQESATQRPTDAEVQYHYGLAAYMMGEEKLAELAFERALQAAQPVAQANEARRWLELLRLDPAQAPAAARAKLEQRLGEEPADPVALRRLAEIYRLKGQTAQATALYEKAIQANPKAILPVLLLAKHYGEQLGDPAKAIEYARKAYSAAPEDPWVMYEVGRMALAVRDYDWALSLFRESTRRLPAHPEAWFDFGLCSHRFGRVRDAEEAVRKALHLGGEFSRTNEARLFLEMVELGKDPARADQGAARLSAVLQADPGCLPARMALGLAQEHRQQVAAALQTYEMILAPTNYPSFLPAARQLALRYAERGLEETRALEFARRMHETDPQDQAITRTLAKLYCRRGEYPWTTRLLDDFVLANPGDTEARFYLLRAQNRLSREKSPRPLYPADVQTAKRLAQEAYGTGNYTWTADLLDDWCRTSLSDADLWYPLGLAQAHLQLAVQARESLARALSLDANHPLAAEAKRALAELR